MSKEQFEKIVNHVKVSGFVYPGSEIYGGLANSWDYGPLGVEMKNNIKKAWWKRFVSECKYNVGLDSAIILNPRVWEASGHVATFSDPLIDCKYCKSRYRADKLIEEFDASIKASTMNNEELENLFKTIKEKHGKLDGILHSIAHANTEDLRNPFINTSKEGFAHANDVSAYTLVAVSRIAKQLDVLAENASIVCLTYYGSTKVLAGYNVMGVAKAALECSVRYLADNLGPDGIRVNAVSAGPIKTLSAKGIKDFNSILDVVEEKAPLRRNVTTKQVGDVVSFLFSNMSKAITGQVIYADSGYSIMGI